MSDFIKPSDLYKVATEKEMARAREIAEADKRRADERHQLQQAFVDRQLHPDVKLRVSAALRAAAERGENHLQVMTFPSELCNDGWRAINNGDPNWPKTLVGFAARFELGADQHIGVHRVSFLLICPTRRSGRPRG